MSEALAIFEEIGDRQGQSAALGSLGNAYSNREYRKAIDYNERALAIFEEIGDRRGQGTLPQRPRQCVQQLRGVPQGHRLRAGVGDLRGDR